MASVRPPRPRRASGFHAARRIDLGAEEFRRLGYQVVDELADFLGRLRDRPVVPAAAGPAGRPRPWGRPAPVRGAPPGPLLHRALRTVADGSVLNAHPRYLGYVTQSAAPLGALADLMASTLNLNLRSAEVAPVASRIEAQTVRWIAEMLGYPRTAAGLLTSGGTEANLLGLFAGLAPRPSPTEGPRPPAVRVYATRETHVWLRKSARLLRLPEDALRWVRTGPDQTLDLGDLDRQVQADRRTAPGTAVVVGNAGTTATGAVDPLREMGRFCRRERLWFHVDAAYGGFALLARDHPPELEGLREADSVAVDPHKWLYAPLEAGCVLVRHPSVLRAALAERPDYYSAPHPARPSAPDFFELGLQNSRAFRALKVWVQIQHLGVSGYRRLIERDLALARRLHRRVTHCPDLEPVGLGLSTSTFRYAPVARRTGEAGEERRLERLNRRLLAAIQASGVAYLSPARVGDRFVLRACVVNFRTTAADVDALVPWVAELARRLDRQRPVRGSSGKALTARSPRSDTGGAGRAVKA